MEPKNAKNKKNRKCVHKPRGKYYEFEQEILLSIRQKNKRTINDRVMSFLCGVRLLVLMVCLLLNNIVFGQ